ncbi:uncharacterized protein [Procambarus clarkii]|uniref:uncharacterized protein n=1 Tax=Procambarus clarkii TaxID=6728 RepID=UPI003744938C
MKVTETSQEVPDSARRRVYCLGIISMVMAAVQVVVFLVMLSFVVTPEHHDTQVLLMCGGMAAVTAAFLLLTARLLFLLYEKRYGETVGTEWMWWFATLAVVLFNSLMVVWFGLLHDIVPAVVCCLAVLTYMLFFKYAKDDIKILRHHNTTQESEGGI